MNKLIIPFLCMLLLTIPAHAAPAPTLRYFEGELLIEQIGGSQGCQRHVGKTRDVQISWQETQTAGDSRISGWIVYGGGAPGKLEGAQPAQLTITSNYYDAHLNTQMTLSLNIADGKATGILHETPAKLSFEEKMCYWQQAKLTLTEKTAETNVVQRMREHAARYKAYAYESRGDYQMRYGNYADAAAALDQAFAEVDGVLPEANAYLSDLLISASRLYERTDDFEHAAQRLQRVLDIGTGQSKLGVDDPAFYRGWIRLASYLYLANHADKAIPVIERATRLEDKAKDVDLNERLQRRRLQGNIHIAAKMFDQARENIQDEINLATAEAGPNDARTFEARARLIIVMMKMKENARFEAAFEPLANEISTRFGESHKLSLDSNETLGMYYYRNKDLSKARLWLERAFRGHRALFDNTKQTIRQNEDAKSILASLLDIYIKQGIVAKDFLDQVREGKATLDDLPFHAAQGAEISLPVGSLAPIKWDKMLQQ